MTAPQPYRWILGIIFAFCPLITSAQSTITPKPADKGSISADDSLSWTLLPVDATATYDVQLTPDTKTATNVLTKSTATSYSPKNQFSAGSYTWKVTAHTAGGDVSGGPWTFTVTAGSGSDIPTTTSGMESFLEKSGFGIALGLTINFQSPDIVTDATVDSNGIVRVNTRSNTSPGFMLEAHTLPWQRGKKAFGFFVAVKPGGDSQIISAVGAGVMLDFKTSDDPKDRKGFGMGFGYASIPSAKTLGDEFIKNHPAPVDSNGHALPIRFETRDKGSLLAILSFTF